MCGRLSQYRGIHDFVAALSMPSALIDYASNQPFERYNAAPSAQLTLFHQEGQYLRADMVRWGWRPQWSKDRAAIKARVERVARNPFFRSIWPHRAIIAIDNWFEWVDEGGPKKQRAEQMMLLQWEPTEAFEWFKVDRAISNVRNQQSGLINPISDSDDRDRPADFVH
ncbi:MULTISPECIES: SOS response-associated peptidase family protein [Pseudomonas]|uniref:Abasic site processing protein n=1 Tax=Pseudomonas wuhanensis TaxID=2954098 RepID=A0ABY9GZ27_9PSED|nr:MULTISPECIES: SOS response-associated peptidase family protein [unclassified Pseudomonas]WLI14359.1 SOS response-associated peptidase family protein [Pseudomonas sp. FP603]WLI20275.1 SOS response-associated peptidase family protein [Pseudomonas sp. FP607]